MVQRRDTTLVHKMNARKRYTIQSPIRTLLPRTKLRSEGTPPHLEAVDADVKSLSVANIHMPTVILV